MTTEPKTTNPAGSPKVETKDYAAFENLVSKLVRVPKAEVNEKEAQRKEAGGRSR